MSAPDSFAPWLNLKPGHVFAAADGHLTRAAQARQHGACDMPMDLFGTRIDPTLLGQDMVLMTSRAGLPVDGRVHVAHRIRQHAPLSFDRPYRLGGRMERLAAVPRGQELELSAAAAGANPPPSPAPVELAATYLLPGLVPSPDTPGERTPAPPDPAAFAPLGRLELTPERVMSYSADVGNLLHFDPAFAAARGFRAPIAQGLMLVTAFLGALLRRQGSVPPRFELTTRFRRPAFWHDRVEFRLGGELWCCVSDDGRLLVDGAFAAGANG